MKMNSQVTNKFNRILIPWRYSPHGVFNNGLFAEALIGVEKSELKTAAGSSADVTFIDTGVWLGYQWVWNDGLNISTAVGLAHLSRSSLDKSISPTESSNVAISWIDRLVLIRIWQWGLSLDGLSESQEIIFQFI